MPQFTVWFSHEAGPYSGQIEAANAQAARDMYRDDPYFIDVQEPGEQPPPVVQEHLRHQAERMTMLPPNLNAVVTAQRRAERRRAEIAAGIRPEDATPAPYYGE